MEKNSFRDPDFNVLKAWGYTDQNQPGDLVRTEADDFNLEPGKWQLVNDQWVAYSPS
ncbi:hypothetical protein V4C53_35790 [Paraburkholderia azotifigens]|uniref:hypothetical protein n=1 Tax=Paraburkholderia azotifigens TaxID=2057004 RepID=UPI0031799D35